MTPTRISPKSFHLSALNLVGLVMFATANFSQAGTAARPSDQPLIIAPTVEGIYLCDEAVADKKIRTLKEAYAFCRKRGMDGATAVTRLLDTLEPGGPKGSVQIGYTATLQLLDLYHRTGKGWEIDDSKVDSFLNVIRKIPRPVVVYLAADHFDSLGPIVEDLRKTPENLMQLRDGKPLQLDYFGYSILPYTLATNPEIPVNHYRFKALEHVAKKIQELPLPVQNRIVAYTLAGELHHMFPDFENGMGAYRDIRVTDYSPESIEGFRQWLRTHYRDLSLIHI